MVTILVSELASILGKNRWNSVDQAVLKLWKRTNSLSYKDALIRSKVKVFSIDHLGYNTKQKLKQLAKEDKVVDISTIKKDPEITSKVDEILNSSSNVLSGSLLHNRRNPIAFEMDVLDKCLSYVRCSNGINNEVSILDKFSDQINKKIINRNDQVYIGDLGQGIYLKGKVDGITVDRTTIVEVKKRQNRLFDSIPDYELIQVQAYINITEISQCFWVQCYKDQLDHILVDQDDEFFENEIKKPVIEWNENWIKFINDKDKQDQFLAGEPFNQLF